MCGGVLAGAVEASRAAPMAVGLPWLPQGRGQGIPPISFPTGGASVPFSSSDVGLRGALAPPVPFPGVPWAPSLPTQAWSHYISNTSHSLSSASPHLYSVKGAWGALRGCECLIGVILRGKMNSLVQQSHVGTQLHLYLFVPRGQCSCAHCPCCVVRGTQKVLQCHKPPPRAVLSGPSGS